MWNAKTDNCNCLNTSTGENTDQNSSWIAANLNKLRYTVQNKLV